MYGLLETVTCVQNNVNSNVMSQWQQELMYAEMTQNLAIEYPPV
jgi:hypothetical protein